jgi:hypothetical protein
MEAGSYVYFVSYLASNSVGTWGDLLAGNAQIYFDKPITDFQQINEIVDKLKKLPGDAKLEKITILSFQLLRIEGSQVQPQAPPTTAANHSPTDSAT